MSNLRIRVAMFLISLTLIGLELALMRILSLRFWSYFASMVISVALLGFGASGAILFLMGERIIRQRQSWLCGLSIAFSLTIPILTWLVQRVPLDVHFFAWDFLGQWPRILAIELILFVPFLLSGAWVGLALMDRPKAISGHYAANLLGSGTGALAVVVMMDYYSVETLLQFLCFPAFAGAILIVPSKPRFWAGCIVISGIGLLLEICYFPGPSLVSPYKKLSLELSKPGTEIIYSREGAMGRLDALRGPAIHDAPPGMSLQNPHPLPPRTLLLLDGNAAAVIYDVQNREEWAFLDYTTDALPFHLNSPGRVLIVGAGGGAPVGLAKYHDSFSITALERNPLMVKSLTGPLAPSGGRIYASPEVRVLAREPRGYLSTTASLYEIILMPVHAGLGSGVLSSQESFLYTVESFAQMIRHLSERGILCVTRYADIPPREGLRLFKIAIEALRANRLDPTQHLALIRSWETVALLVSKHPWSTEQLHEIRAFCHERSFDLCYLPDIQVSEANQYHILAEPFYYEGAKALLGPERKLFLREYLFNIDASTDDWPFFFSFMKWSAIARIKQQLKGRAAAYLEVGTVLLLAAFIQTALLSPFIILSPLLPGIRVMRRLRGKGLTFAYFLLIGVGFMFLEMGFIHKLILYLSHPIYSTALVLASFLVFSGVGSILSSRWKFSVSRRVQYASGAAVLISLLYIMLLDKFLHAVMFESIFLRCLVAGAAIAPLAVAMGHLFPLGLVRLSDSSARMIPWAWAINGVASVMATVATPLLAMHSGFSAILVVAAVCYLLAGRIFDRLPERVNSTTGGHAGGEGGI